MTFGLIVAIVCTFSAEPSSNAPGPLSPSESLKRIEHPDNIVLEVVASEPLVVDPVAMSFDKLGRLYVVEYRDYPNGPNEGEPPLSRVKLLEDTDGDGIMDQSHIFAEDLSFAQGVLAWNDGVIVTAAPNICFFKDTDGDHRADVKRTLLTGFKPGNPQLRTAHPRRGLDNWIYVTNGLSGGEISKPGSADKGLDIRGFDLRFDPNSLAFERTTGRAQFGNTFDNWGHRFYCSNRNPIRHAVLPHYAVERNPYALLTDTSTDVAPFGGDAKVYPIVATKTTADTHAGTNTAACGVTCYRGSALGPNFLENVFVCEPTGHLVTRYRLEPDGPTFKAFRTEERSEFLASDDPWFRPVSMANGPDGTLYLADMYRQVIEHPQFMPKGLAETLDLRAGEDKGRIYRIRVKGRPSLDYTPPASDDEMLTLLTSPNGWQRDLAQRLIVDQQRTDLVPRLRSMLTAPSALARVHALGALDGLDKVSVSDLERLLDDHDPRVQGQAIKLAVGELEDHPRLLAKFIALTTSDDPKVRFELMLALGESDHPGLLPTLTELAVRDGDDPWMRRALLTSCATRSALLLSRLVDRSEFKVAKGTRGMDLMRSLSRSVGERGDLDELRLLFELIAESDDADAWWQTVTIDGLAEGLRYHRGGLGRTTLGKLLQSPPEPLQGSVENIRKILTSATDIAKDESRPQRDRIGAVRLVGHLSFEEASPVFTALLKPNQTGALATATIESMKTLNDPRSLPILVNAWSTLLPPQRSAALELAFRRSDTTKGLLEAMDSGDVPRGVVGLERRRLLLRHRDKDIKALAVKVFGGEISENRREVVDKYLPALGNPGDPHHGQLVFRKRCSVCHRIAGEGHIVGPDISDVRNKTPQTLLYDILDPNRAVDPRYTDYVIVTNDGNVVNGLLAGETSEAIVLRGAEGKENIVPRGDIEEMRATGKSIMPEGFEKDLSVTDLADLIAFLKSRK
ncbi:Cytochrome c [Planctomycetes bacterium Pan216]|uniref:Cytochrome c n=1 Tax=Kolteria novifilia TaxID=2527975 RepID=A0A518BAL2_9BACT|nr:Cytochrome c [Planctomycetes bacterium Pan216]